MLRKALKSGVANALYRSGADRIIGASSGKSGTPLVIGYHRVVEDFADSAKRTIPSMLISSRMLARQLDWVGSHFEFVPMDDVAAWAKGEKQFDRPVAAVTFDDGYADVYEHGFPILRRKGIPAATYVVTDIVGTRDLQVHDELYLLVSAGFSVWKAPMQRLQTLLNVRGIDAPLPSRSGSNANPFDIMRIMFESVPQSILRRVVEALRSEIELPDCLVKEHQAMDWDMARAMQESDMTIGSHTCSHTLLTNESRTKTLSEIEDSRRAAERELGGPVRHFAYPDGRFDANVVRAVDAAGYDSAVTTCRHLDESHPWLTIPRRLWWEKSCVNLAGRFSPSIMSCQVNGVFDATEKCFQDHG